ncbi:MAG: glycosyltransferase family 2 protein [Verrucomicrobia bacterium]|nr:glycosyltransferase family 2 protein [Verrucomicrobiota bacterium]
MKISFCLITLNEEENLPRCLKSCAETADEIVIVDCGSTDATREIAAGFGARWLVHEWPGYVAQKNRALALAQHEWVFSIDADEELSPALRSELAKLKATAPAPEVGGFSVSRCVFYEGRWIRHGDWYPDRLLRLARRNRGVEFVGGKVHERMEVGGTVKHLSGDLHHYSFKDAADHWRRCQKYAQLWAESQWEAGRTAGSLSPYLHATLRWCRGYLLKRGFLDGRQGWLIARLISREVFLKYSHLLELQRNQHRTSNIEL